MRRSVSLLVRLSVCPTSENINRFSKSINHCAPPPTIPTPLPPPRLTPPPSPLPLLQVRLVFVAYDKVTSIINGVVPPPEIDDDDDDDDHVISKPISPSSSASASEKKGNWTVNSRVMTASVSAAKKWTDVAAPISITFRNEIPVSKDAGKRDGAGMYIYILSHFCVLHRCHFISFITPAIYAPLHTRGPRTG